MVFSNDDFSVFTICYVFILALEQRYKSNA